MKKLILILATIIAISQIALSQDEGIQTVFGNKELKISGFGGPFMTFGSFDNEFAHMMGGGGGVILNNFFVGGYGLGMTTNIPYKNDAIYNVDFGHGGFWLGYNFFSNRVIHPVIHVQLGWGGISKDYDDENQSHLDTDHDAVFVVSPSIELETNITNFFKIGIGGNYRQVFLVDGPYEVNELNDFGVILSFKFGWFE